MKSSEIGSLTEIDKKNKMRGVVVDVYDPMLEGRVALMIPKLALKYDPTVTETDTKSLNINKDMIANSGMQQHTKDTIEVINYLWARPSSKNYMIPYKGETVYCYMEDGDPNKLYWQRMFPTLNGEVTEMELVKNGANKFNKEAKPFIHVFEEFSDSTIVYYDENSNSKRLAATMKNGHSISMNNNAKENNIELITGGKHRVVMDDLNKNITITSTSGHTAKLDDSGKNVLIKTAGGHSVNMTDSGKNVLVKTTSGHSINMSDSSSTIVISISGGAKVIIDRTSVTLKSTGVGKLVVHPGGISGM